MINFNNSLFQYIKHPSHGEKKLIFWYFIKYIKYYVHTNVNINIKSSFFYKDTY